MQIADVQHLSLLDFPDQVSAIVFTPGCTFRCPFCYNAEMVLPGKIKKYVDAVPEKEFFGFLAKRKGLLDGVVITGGEPTMQADLADFMKRVKEMGFLVKLDTNGSHPGKLKALLEADLLDYVAMDIKCALDNYPAVTRSRVSPEKIKESVELLMEAGRVRKLPYEFRTTILPAFHNVREMRKIGALIKGAPKYALQQFIPAKTLDAKFKEAAKFSLKDLERLAEVARKYVKEVELRK